MKKESSNDIRNRKGLFKNITKPETNFYEKGSVQIVGYGLPKLSFDSRHITLLNRHRTPQKRHKADLITYVLDLDKMSPMQGIIELRINFLKPVGTKIINNIVILSFQNKSRFDCYLQHFVILTSFLTAIYNTW